MRCMGVKFKVRTCNWLRHLGTKEHRDGMGLKTEVVGKIWVARARGRRGEKLKCTTYTLTL